MKFALLWLAVVLVVLPSLFLATCHYIENPKSHYANMQEARSDRAIERGWIPAFIPDSATDIIEQHNIDTNSGYLSFVLPESSALVNGKPCAPIDHSDVKWYSSYPIWWPAVLDGSNEETAKLKYYYCGEGLAGVEYEGRHYIWTPGA